MHDTPICFNARHRFHMEPHDGKMWALAAYTPLIYRRASVPHIDMLKLCGFPTSAGIDGPHAHQARFHKCENKRAMMLMRIRTQAFGRSSGLAAGLGWSFVVAAGFANRPWDQGRELFGRGRGLQLRYKTTRQPTLTLERLSHCLIFSAGSRLEPPIWH